MTAPAAPSHLLPNRILLPLIVACALFMENLDSTVLATALPAIAQDFGESPIRLKLALTSYLLALAVFLPASGWLADRFGVRLIFRLALVLFTTGSIFCGLSDSIGGLIAARVVQGIGGAMMVPVGRLVILRSVPKADLIGAMAWLTMPALIGPLLGPPLGGFITTYFDWRWIFWINIPIGVLGFVLATLFFPDIRGETRSRFDALGFALIGLGLATFVTGSTSLGLGVMQAWAVITLLAVGAALLLGYLAHYRRASNPILDLGLLRLPSFRVAVVGGSIFRVGIGAFPFLLPLMLQLAFGLTPFASGSITFATAIGAMLMKVAAQPILRRFGFRPVLIVNALIASIFVAVPAAFTPETPVWLITGLLLCGGFFRSLQFTSINTLTYAEVTPERMSNATSFSSVMQQLSLSVGISIGAIVLELAVGGGIPAAPGDFTGAFLIVAGISASAALLFLTLPHNAGAEISGRREISAAPPETDRV